MAEQAGKTTPEPETIPGVVPMTPRSALGPPVVPKRTRPDLAPAGFPSKVEQVLVNVRTDEQRTYLQTELPIDGEAQLLGLIEQVGRIVSEREFPWGTLGKMFSPEGQATLNPTELGQDGIKMLGIVAAAAPDAIVDSACIFFGIYQFDEDGKPNPQWAEDRKFIRRSLNFTRWVELVQTFMAQNDYSRLAAPFGQALTTGALTGAALRRPVAETPT